jgi:hypothetical protein
MKSPFKKQQADPKFDIVSIYCDCCERVNLFDEDEYYDGYERHIRHARERGRDVSDVESRNSAEQEFFCRLMEKNGHANCCCY